VNSWSKKCNQCLLSQ